MTRFKEMRRIENAILHSNKEELEWALSYAKSRIALAKRKDHLKYWKNLEKRIQTTLSEIAS